MQHTNSSYSGSAFRKTDDYDDDGYEMVQEPYEGEKYPSVDDISPPSFHEPGFRKSEPKSPSFNKHESQQSSQTLQSNKTSNPSKHHTQGENQEFIKQLMGKIRKQAENLLQLENYKLLCEKRIRDLVPIHPLPIESYHIGNSDYVNKQLSELQRELRAKEEELIQVQSEYRLLSQRSKSIPASGDRSQKTDTQYSSPMKFQGDDSGGNYNILYNKYKALLNEKMSLEESLRNETLANEEQRAYIEILKQMLDDRFDKLALSQWITGLPTHEKIDALFELKNLNEQLRGTEREAEGYRERMKDSEFEIQRLRDDLNKLSEKNSRLIEENVQLNELNIKLNQNVRDYEGELKKIEEEKTNLIDYADEKEKKYLDIKVDLEASSAQVERLLADNDKLLENQEQNLNEIRDLQDRLLEIENQNNNLRNENNELIQKIGQAEENNESIEMDARQNFEKIREEYSNLIRDKDHQIDRLNREMDSLEHELKSLKEMYNDKDLELQNINYKQNLDRDTLVANHEIKIRSYERNELNLKALIEKQSHENTQHLNKISILEDQKIDLENELNNLKRDYDDLHFHHDDLKKRLEKIERLKAEADEKLMTLSREVSKSREESINNLRRVHELSELNSTLERKITEKEHELTSFDGILNESKERFEKDKTSRAEEVKKLLEENSNMRFELRTLKENYSRAASSVEMKEDENNMLRGHLEKKNQHIQALLDENRQQKQRIEDLSAMREQVDILRNEKDRSFKEIKDYEEIIDTKNSTLRNTMVKLESAEHELAILNENYRRAQAEREDFFTENTKLRQRVIDLEEDDRILRASLDEKSEQIGRLIHENEKMQKHIENLLKEVEDLSSTHTKQREDNFTSRQEEEKFRTCLEKSYPFVKQLLQIGSGYVQTFLNLINTNGEINVYLSKKFREVLNSFDYTSFLKEDELSTPTLLEYMVQNFEIFLEEIESLLRRVIDLKQDLHISNQRVGTLEKKCLNLNQEEGALRQKEIELRKELELLKDDRLLGNKSISHLSQFEELKRENKRLQSELKERLHTPPTFRNKDVFEEDPEAQINEDRYKIVLKEKRSLEEIINKLTTLIANPDVKKLISDLMKLQSEIDACEREKFNLELFLTDLETDFKLLLKRGASPQNAGEKRSQIEQKRNELNNSTSQITILKKRKQILYDEIKSFELVEKRRYETCMETEKNLVETKKELNEIKSQKQGLENVTTNLKETVKNISKEKQFLDYENMRLKYTLGREDQENNKLMSNFQNSNFEKNQAAHRREDSADYQPKFMREAPMKSNHDSMLEEDNIQPKSQNDGSFTDRNLSKKQPESSTSYYSEKKTFSAARQEGESLSQLKLKDRLNHAKNLLSSMKKTIDRSDI